MRAPDGGIMGVYSLSKETPLKRAGFPDIYEAFALAATYREWQFLYTATKASREQN